MQSDSCINCVSAKSHKRIKRLEKLIDVEYDRLPIDGMEGGSSSGDDSSSSSSSDSGMESHSHSLVGKRLEKGAQRLGFVKVQRDFKAITAIFRLDVL